MHIRGCVFLGLLVGVLVAQPCIVNLNDGTNNCTYNLTSISGETYSFLAKTGAGEDANYTVGICRSFPARPQIEGSSVNMSVSQFIPNPNVPPAKEYVVGRLPPQLRSWFTNTLPANGLYTSAGLDFI